MKLRRDLSNYVLRLVFCVFIIGLIFQSTATAADWPNWRGPNYDGISSETGWSSTWPSGGPKIAWKTTLGKGFCSISISKGRVYTMGNIGDEDILYCFDEKTGKEIWKQSYACPLFAKNHEGGPAATPTVDGDAVYTFSKNGDILRYDAATGKVVWHKNVKKDLGAKSPTWYFAGSPFIMGDIVILGAGTSGIALKKADGSVVWKNGTSASGYSTPAPFTQDGKKCVALFAAKEVVGMVASTGKIIWQYGWKTSYNANIATPIVTDNTVFISSGYNTGCALLKIDGSNVTEIWRNKNMRNHFNNTVLWKGNLYGFDEKELKCLDFKTGEVKWGKQGLGKGSLMIADGKLVILSERGKLVIADATSSGFKELASAQVLTGKCWTVPVLSNGRIYARNANGDFVCVDVSG